MKFEVYLEKIRKCTDVNELHQIRNDILYEDNDELTKGDMFLLAEFIEFKRHYL